MKYCESDQNAANQWQSHRLYNIHGFQFIITTIVIILKLYYKSAIKKRTLPIESIEKDIIISVTFLKSIN